MWNNVRLPNIKPRLPWRLYLAAGWRSCPIELDQNHLGAHLGPCAGSPWDRQDLMNMWRKKKRSKHEESVIFLAIIIIIIITYHIISYHLLLLHLLLDVKRSIFSACRLCKAKVPSEGATTHLEAEQGPSDLSRGKSYLDAEGILEYLIYRIYAHSRAEIFGYLHLSPLFLPSTWSANSVSCWRTQLIAVGRLDHLIIRLGQHPRAHVVHVKVAASYHYGYSSLSKF